VSADAPATVALLFARHGETADNAGGKILGHRDPPLSQAGREQAARLAVSARDAGVVAIWTSPLLRARQTATAVAEATGIQPTVLDDLIESDRGSWEGQSVSHLAEISPALHAAFENADPAFAFPGGESLGEQVLRTRRALTVVAAGLTPALVVAHVGTIRAAMLALGQHPPPERAMPHGEIVTLEWPVGGDREDRRPLGLG
jgi:broad specificity phosphatase PhoE